MGSCNCKRGLRGFPATLNYKEYVGIISQEGTDAPTFQDVSADGITFTPFYDGLGLYHILVDGIAPFAKLIVVTPVLTPEDNDVSKQVRVLTEDDNTITITVKDIANNFYDDMIQNRNIIFRVYN